MLLVHQNFSGGFACTKMVQGSSLPMFHSYPRYVQQSRRSFTPNRAIALIVGTTKSNVQICIQLGWGHRATSRCSVKSAKINDQIIESARRRNQPRAQAILPEASPILFSPVLESGPARSADLAFGSSSTTPHSQTCSGAEQCKQ